MADFCTNCSKEMGFGLPDIDVQAEFKKISPGYYLTVLCEGCGLTAISRTDSDELKVSYIRTPNINEVIWVDYPEPTLLVGSDGKLKVDIDL